MTALTLRTQSRGVRCIAPFYSKLGASGLQYRRFDYDYGASQMELCISCGQTNVGRGTSQHPENQNSDMLELYFADISHTLHGPHAHLLLVGERALGVLQRVGDDLVSEGDVDLFER